MKNKTFKKLTLTLMAAVLTSCGGQKAAQLVDALDDSAWESSQWISAANAPVVTGRIEDGSRAADGANWFVGMVQNEQKVVSAKWMTTGLGVYDLYVNGTLVGEEILKPGFTHSGKTKRSFTYDVTQLLDTKENAQNQLAAQVTPGWWADKMITPSGSEGFYGRKCAFRGVLALTYSDGTTKCYGTETDTWKAGIAGPVKHADIFDGEVYDAREKQGFETPELLCTPELNTEFNGQILPTNGAEVYLRRDLALDPVRAYIWRGVTNASDEAYGKVVVTKEFAPGESIILHPEETLVVDFGQNCAGVPSFVFNAKEGTQLTCLPGELLNDSLGMKSRGMDGPEGSVHRLNLRIPDQGMRLDYIFAASEKPVTFYPQNTFFGYRLVSITATDEVTINQVQTIPVTSIAKNLETGVITTGNDLVNKLISNTLWGQRSNYLSVTTDCPQRNERLGWTADTQVFAETGTYFANTAPFFHKWMQDMRDTQSPLGGYPGVAPFAQYGAMPTDMMRVGWADAGVIVPWTIWKQFADTKIIDESWASMERFMNHVAETKYDHQALSAENGNYQWADWLSYEPLESCSGKQYGPDGLLPEAEDYWNYLCASYWIIDAGMMCDMARATGRDAEHYEAMLAEARAYVTERFLNGDGTFRNEILNTMQTPALFALKNNIVQGEARDNMIARLRQNFAEHDNCLQTGFLGTSILMPTLTDNGMADIAYELLLQRKNPSWLYSIDNGATTIWERWNSYMIEYGMGPRGMNSFNHYAYGCVCQWLWQSAAGIAADPAQPGFRHIIMRPVPDKRLGSLTAEYQSAAGLIKSAWHYDGDQWEWSFTIPKGATATVTLPGQTQAKDYEAGTYTVRL